MPVKICVVNEEAEEKVPSDYLFDEDRVTIGRGEENDLTISDPKRVVSSKHAMVKRDGDTYKLVDRGSKNFTYVGNQRITAKKPYVLHDGDTFRIGDFRLEFRVIETNTASTAQGGETVFDHDFSNPFEEPIRTVQEALNALVEVYDQESPQRRDEALKEAVRDAPDSAVDHSAVRQALHMVGGLRPADSTGATATDDTSSSDASRLHLESSPSAREKKSHPPADQPVRAPNPVADSVVDALSEALAEVVPIPWRFRHEFIGQTVMQAPETQFLYEGDGQVIKDHLLDPTISKEEREERLRVVRDAAESVGVHQVAMLNGYKASVMKGAEELLERLDPDVHGREVKDRNVFFDYVPMLASPATLDRLRAEWQELHRGDSSVAEQRIFRPAFTKAYLARMTAPGTTDGDTNRDSGGQNGHR